VEAKAEAKTKAKAEAEENYLAVGWSSAVVSEVELSPPTIEILSTIHIFANVSIAFNFYLYFNL